MRVATSFGFFLMMSKISSGETLHYAPVSVFEFYTSVVDFDTFPAVVITTPLNRLFSLALDSLVLSSFRISYTRGFVYGGWTASEGHILIFSVTFVKCLS